MIKRLALPLGLAAVAFLLGWLLGRGDSPPAPAPSVRPSADVELRLDAGGVTLLPEGGLELRPIEPLDAGPNGEVDE
jgi:hypothetical protein